jgi:hypothetical protein
VIRVSQQAALRIHRIDGVGRRLEIDRHTVAMRNHVVAGRAARGLREDVDRFIVVARIEDAPAQDRDRNSDAAFIGAGSKHVPAHHDAFFVEAVTPYHSGFDDERQRGFAELAHAQHDHRIQSGAAPIPVLADDDALALRSGRQRDDRRALRRCAAAARGAVHELGPAIHRNDILELLLRALRDASQLRDDRRIDRLDLLQEPARALADLVQRHLRVPPENPEVKIDRACDPVGCVLSVLDPARVRIAFDVDDGKGLVGKRAHEGASLSG